MRRYVVASLVLAALTACGDNTSSENNLGDAVSGMCTTEGENQQVFESLQKDYFWYRDLPASINPSAYKSSNDLLTAVKSSKDRFSFIITSQEYQDRYINARYVGFGFSQQINSRRDGLLMAYVYTDSSAYREGLRRGDTITHIDNIPVATWLADIDAKRKTNDDMFGTATAGVQRTVRWTSHNGNVVERLLTKSAVTTNTILHSSVQRLDGRTIGYMVQSSFIDLTESELNTVFDQFKAQNVDTLVLDLRYNGGGLIRVANQLSSQIAWPQVNGQVFVQYRYNDKNSNKNESSAFSLGNGRQALGLKKVYVLTSPSTCSASEMVINSLRPFIDVVTIGETTCGKPIGMMPSNICNKVLFAINFQTVNARGFGDYFDGLPAQCQVKPTIAGDWGSDADPQWQAALTHIKTGSCPAFATANQTAIGAAPIQDTLGQEPAAIWWRNER
jgi:C-terminal processing protease CtpA/Prc